jgi:integrase
VVQAQQSGNVGTPPCGGVQQVVQEVVGDENPNIYRNHGAYVNAASKIVSQALQSGLITKKCSKCIINQFAHRVPVANQNSCGHITPPTQCTQVTAEDFKLQAFGPWASALDHAENLGYVERIVREACTKAGIEKKRSHPHVLRHSFAVNAVLQRVPLPILQRWMRHSDINNTMVYLQILSQDTRDFYEALEF